MTKAGTGVEKIKCNLKQNKFVILSFFLPCILMIAGFIRAGFYPFGENQVAVIDLYHQYFPFLSELQDKLQSGGSLLYSWNGGLGTNFLALLAYYAASPLYLITMLIPQAYLMEGMTLLIAVKTGIAGCCMAVYLQGVFRYKGWGIPAFSLLYSLCAYVMGYYWCIMWLDVVALLPLCILGLNRLIDRGDFKLYTISLAVMLLVNFYIGGMMCIFIFFYYPVLYFSKARRRGMRGCARVTGKAVFCSFLGIAISAVLLLPVFLSLQHTYYIDSSLPETSQMYHAILDVLTNLLPGIAPTVREGLPNIYCGMVTVILTIFFLLCRQISLKKRLLYCGMLAFLILSLNWNQLDFLWHGLHFPNQLPFRYSFVVSFLLLTMAFEAFLHLHTVPGKRIGAVAAGIAGYSILAEKWYEDVLKEEFVYVALVLLFVYCGIFALYKAGKIPAFLVGFLVFVMVTAEMLGSVVSGISTVSHTDRNTYMESRQEVLDMIEDTRKSDTDFYRMEMMNRVTLNDPMLYHYPGVSQFSSTVNGKVSYLMEHLGLEGEDVRNRYNYTATTPLLNALLNVKYLMGRGTTVAGEEAFFRLKGGTGISGIYENRYPLSVGFMVDPEIRDWDYEDPLPFTVQNDFAEKAAGAEGELLTPIGAPAAIYTENALVREQETGHFSCQAEDGEKISEVTLEFEAAEAQYLYVMVETDGAEWITAQRRDGRVISLQADCGAVVNTGSYEAGERLSVKIHYPEGEAGEIEAYVYGLDQNVWEETYRGLADEQLQVSEHDDRTIEGTIKAKKDGYFLMSVPYDEGWTVEVDGEPAEVEPLADALIMTPMKKGAHTVRIHYVPEGLVAGCVMSVCGILLLGVLIVLRRKKHILVAAVRKKREKEIQAQ